MYPPLFSLCSVDPVVQSLFGTSPCRVYQQGEAPQVGTAYYQMPYAEWQIITGVPENYLDKTPDIDSMITQIDVYATTSQASLDGALAIRDTLEPHAYVTSWRGTTRDPDTLDYRTSFDVSWFVKR